VRCLWLFLVSGVRGFLSRRQRVPGLGDSRVLPVSGTGTSGIEMPGGGSGTRGFGLGLVSVVSVA
jgi:hypothetical protein